MNLLKRIKDVLNEQITGYRVLLDLLQQERGCLLSLNTIHFEELSKEKDTAVLKLRLLEEERIRLIKLFALGKGIPETINLQKLSEITDDETFMTLRSQLISLLQSIGELNDFNRILIERSVNFAKNALGMLRSLGLDTQQERCIPALSREV